MLNYLNSLFFCNTVKYTPQNKEIECKNKDTVPFTKIYCIFFNSFS